MRIIFSPVHPWYIHFSKVLATFIFCFVTYLIVCLFLSIVVGVNYGGENSWALILILALSIFFCSALGVLVCCLLKSESSANQIISLLVVIFAFLGGLFFPVNGFGSAISFASWVSPAKWMLVSTFQIIYDSDFSSLLPASGILILLSVASILLSIKIFNGEEYL